MKFTFLQDWSVQFCPVSLVTQKFLGHTYIQTQHRTGGFYADADDSTESIAATFATAATFASVATFATFATFVTSVTFATFAT